MTIPPEEPEDDLTRYRNGTNGRAKHIDGVNGHSIPSQDRRHTEPIPFLREPVWDKQFNETMAAYAAFSIYKNMGRSRSADAAYRSTRGSTVTSGGVRPHERPGRWRTWAQHWRWLDRAEAWDAHLDALERAAQEAAATERGKAMAARREAQRATELDLGDQLIRRALEMLGLPIVDTETTSVDEDGRRLAVTIKAAKWRVADAARMAEVAVQLRRLALEMETSRTAVKVDMEDEVRELARQFGFDEHAAISLAREIANEAVS